MDTMQKIFEERIESKKQALRDAKAKREESDKKSYNTCLELVNKLSWLNKYNLIPKIVKVETILSSNKYGVSFENWDFLTIVPITPTKFFISRDYALHLDIFTETELAEYLADHISVHI